MNKSLISPSCTGDLQLRSRTMGLHEECQIKRPLSTRSFREIRGDDAADGSEIGYEEV